jgi:hypothetical protein
VRLCINQGNPQSSHFWHRCGFRSLYEAEREEETVIVAEKNLKEEMNMKTAVAYFSASGVTAAKAKEIAEVAAAAVEARAEQEYQRMNHLLSMRGKAGNNTQLQQLRKNAQEWKKIISNPQIRLDAIRLLVCR